MTIEQRQSMIAARFTYCPHWRTALSVICIVTTAVSGQVAPERSASDRTPFRIVGYLPDYRLNDFNESSARQITDLVVFSADVDSSGRLETRRFSPDQLRRLKQIKQRTRVSLIFCVGGWERSRGFAKMSASKESRALFVKDAIRFCLDERFDGVDLDWEHPANESEQQNYAVLLADVKEGFREHGLRVSVTMAAWQKLSADAFRSVDAVQVMAYDHNGQHSTLEGAQQDVQSLLDRGVPAEKLVLGLPFYGRGDADSRRTMTYGEIVRTHAPKPDVDEVSGVYFNGPRTIQRKVQFAQKSKLAGVMIWELGQDASGESSLLRVIGDREK